MDNLFDDDVESKIAPTAPSWPLWTLVALSACVVVVALFNVPRRSIVANIVVVVASFVLLLLYRLSLVAVSSSGGRGRVRGRGQDEGETCHFRRGDWLLCQRHRDRPGGRELGDVVLMRRRFAVALVALFILVLSVAMVPSSLRGRY